MPVSVIKLPAKAGKLEYSEEDQTAALEALANVEAGHGVQVDDPQDTENKARVRARVFAALIADQVDDAYRIRVHTVKQETGQGATKRTKWVPALSLGKARQAPAATEES